MQCEVLLVPQRHLFARCESHCGRGSRGSGSVCEMSSCSVRRTTFVQNLLGPYAQQPDLAVNGVTGPEALKTFENAPEKMATVVEVQDNNSLTNFHYSVQDTPGAIVLRLGEPRVIGPNMMLCRCTGAAAVCTTSSMHAWRVQCRTSVDGHCLKEDCARGVDVSKSQVSKKYPAGGADNHS